MAELSSPLISAPFCWQASRSPVGAQTRDGLQYLYYENDSGEPIGSEEYSRFVSITTLEERGAFFWRKRGEKNVPDRKGPIASSSSENILGFSFDELLNPDSSVTVQVYEPGGILQEMGFFTSPKFSRTLSPEEVAIYRSEEKISKCIPWQEDGDVCYEFSPSLGALLFTCYNHAGFGFFNDVRRNVADPLAMEKDIIGSCFATLKYQHTNSDQR